MDRIANIIFSQIGGRRFAAMTGARDFVAIENGLRFRIGSNASRTNLVKIILRGDDTYTMQFWHMGREVNEYAIARRYFDKGLSYEEFNRKVAAAKARAMKQAGLKLLKECTGIYFDQLERLFTDYTKLETRL